MAGYAASGKLWAGHPSAWVVPLTAGSRFSGRLPHAQPAHDSEHDPRLRERQPGRRAPFPGLLGEPYVDGQAATTEADAPLLRWHVPGPVEQVGGCLLPDEG
jgi:hypothetical protein